MKHNDKQTKSNDVEEHIKSILSFFAVDYYNAQLKETIYPEKVENAYKEATQAIQQLIDEARIDELVKLKDAHSIAIFDEYLEKRLTHLKGNK